jgi:hypothetical protein
MELSMSWLLQRTCFVLCVIGVVSSLAAIPAGAATSAGPGTPATPRVCKQTTDQPVRVKKILDAFPNGGQGLSDAIAKAVEADPCLASAIVAAALDANAAQQSAIGTGLADAAIFFANSDSPDAKEAQEILQAAIASAPGGTISAFNVGGGPTALSTLPGSTAGPALTTSGCVSPSRPGNGC